MRWLERLKDLFFELIPSIIFGSMSYIMINFLPFWLSPLAALFVFIFLLWCYFQNKPHIDLRNIVGSALTGTFPAISAIAVTILFIIYTSWLADLLQPSRWNEQVGETNVLSDTITVLAFIFSLPFVFIFSLRENQPRVSERREKKKVFIGALSKLNALKGKDKNEEWKKLLEIIEEGIECPDRKLEKVLLNWSPLFRAIFYHVPVLERVYILVSPQSGEYKKDFEDILKEYQNKTGHGFDIKFSREISFDDYEEIHCELRRIIKEIKRDGYRDEDISVYISGGTSAVTLALTLLAVKEGRQVEYLEQTSGGAKILSINVNIEDLFSLAPELKAREMSGS